MHASISNFSGRNNYLNELCFVVLITVNTWYCTCDISRNICFSVWNKFEITFSCNEIRNTNLIWIILLIFIKLSGMTVNSSAKIICLLLLTKKYYPKNVQNKVFSLSKNKVKEFIFTYLSYWDVIEQKIKYIMV